jgi:hypothetical protein
VLQCHSKSLVFVLEIKNVKIKIYGTIVSPVLCMGEKLGHTLWE